MDFRYVVAREVLLEGRRIQIRELESRIKSLESLIFNIKEEKDAKENLKTAMFREFDEYFKKAEFSEISPVKRFPNKFLGEIQSICASVGNYRVVMSITQNYEMHLEIPHVNDFKKEEYKLTCMVYADTCNSSGITLKTIENTSDISKYNEHIDYLNEVVRSLQVKVNSKKPTKVAYIFAEGQEIASNYEFTTFAEIISSIPAR